MSFRRLLQGVQTNGSRAEGLSALRPPQFQQLERQAGRLQALLILLMGMIAILSTSVFFFLELSRLRDDAGMFAADIAQLAAFAQEEQDSNLEHLSAQIEGAMKLHDAVFVRLVGREGEEILRRGDPDQSLLPARHTLHLSPEAPFHEIQVELDGRSIPPRTARVFGIHLLVAALLTLAIYRLPVRALYRAVSELESTHAQLLHSERLSAIGEIYASLTHEINNPLGIILSRVKLMLATARESEADSGLVRDLEMIDRHGTRIAEIIRGLLAFARRDTLQPVETDLNRVIEDVVKLIERPFAKHDIQIRSILAPALPSLQASPHHLQQVFMNLLSNARDAMPGGGVITLRTSRSNGHLIAEVEDTGTGIEEEHRPRLFEPFFTTKDVGKGTGLGLSVSYGIVRAHGGSIEVRSEQGHGALFRISLPIEVKPQ